MKKYYIGKENISTLGQDKRHLFQRQDDGTAFAVGDVYYPFTVDEAVYVPDSLVSEVKKSAIFDPKNVHSY